jgi:hypothetical protein
VQINIYEFGDNVVIEDGATMIGHVVDNGYIQHAPTKFAHGAYLGANSVVQPGSTIGENVHIMPLSLVIKGEQGFAPGTWWQGLSLADQFALWTRDHLLIMVSYRNTGAACQQPAGADFGFYRRNPACIVSGVQASNCSRISDGRGNGDMGGSDDSCRRVRE